MIFKAGQYVYFLSPRDGVEIVELESQEVNEKPLHFYSEIERRWVSITEEGRSDSGNNLPCIFEMSSNNFSLLSELYEDYYEIPDPIIGSALTATILLKEKKDRLAYVSDESDNDAVEGGEVAVINARHFEFHNTFGDYRNREFRFAVLTDEYGDVIETVEEGLKNMKGEQ